MAPAKVDLLPIEKDSEKKEVAKKYKTFQIPKKLLVTFCPLHVIHKTNLIDIVSFIMYF